MDPEVIPLFHFTILSLFNAVDLLQELLGREIQPTPPLRPSAPLCVRLGWLLSLPLRQFVIFMSTLSPP